MCALIRPVMAVRTSPMHTCSVNGAAISGILIGVLENLSEGYIGQGLKEISGFLVILVVLMIRPYGLFGTPEIERV